jgi:hypothetical protein
MDTLRIRQEILDRGEGVPLGDSTYYFNSEPLPARDHPDNEDETQVLYQGRWENVVNTDWE